MKSNGECFLYENKSVVRQEKTLNALIQSVFIIEPVKIFDKKFWFQAGCNSSVIRDLHDFMNIWIEYDFITKKFQKMEF